MTALSPDDEHASDSEGGDPASLYDPPKEESEQVASEGGEEYEEFHIEIPRDLARRLLRVSMHLGLSPSLVASRAIDLVWDEIGSVEREKSLSTQTLIQRYQARVDILQILEAGLEDGQSGHATKSESSQSPQSVSEGQGTHAGSEDAQLWDAVEKVQEVVADEDGAEASAESSVKIRRQPEKEDHSWDEVDEIIETGEESRGT